MAGRAVAGPDVHDSLYDGRGSFLSRRSYDPEDATLTLALPTGVAEVALEVAEADGMVLEFARTSTFRTPLCQDSPNSYGSDLTLFLCETLCPPSLRALTIEECVTIGGTFSTSTKCSLPRGFVCAKEGVEYRAESGLVSLQTIVPGIEMITEQFYPYEVIDVDTAGRVESLLLKFQDYDSQTLSIVAPALRGATQMRWHVYSPPAIGGYHGAVLSYEVIDVDTAGRVECFADSRSVSCWSDHAGTSTRPLQGAPRARRRARSPPPPPLPPLAPWEAILSPGNEHDLYGNCTEGEPLVQCDPAASFVPYLETKYVRSVPIAAVGASLADGNTYENLEGSIDAKQHVVSSARPSPTVTSKVARSGSHSVKFNASRDEAVSHPVPPYMRGAYQLDLHYSLTTEEGSTPALRVQLQCQTDATTAWTVVASYGGLVASNGYTEQRSAGSHEATLRWRHLRVLYDLTHRRTQVLLDGVSVGVLSLPSDCFHVDRLHLVAQDGIVYVDDLAVGAAAPGSVPEALTATEADADVADGPLSGDTQLRSSHHDSDGPPRDRRRVPPRIRWCHAALPQRPRRRPLGIDPRAPGRSVPARRVGDHPRQVRRRGDPVEARHAPRHPPADENGGRRAPRLGVPAQARRARGSVDGRATRRRRGGSSPREAPVHARGPRRRLAEARRQRRLRRLE